MKILKKALKILGITLGTLLVLAILIPIIFGKQIKEAVRNYVNDQIEGEVYFEDVSIGIFSNFPHLTVTLENFGVVGDGEFKGDTLVQAENFNVVVNLWSALFGDEYEVRKLELHRPKIHAHVLKTGKPNWDIWKTDGEAEPVAEADTTASDPVRLRLQKLSISDAHIVYDDEYSNMYFEFADLNFSGSGDLQNEVFDFDTYTSAEEMTIRMGGVNYFYKAALDMDMTLNIDSERSRYTFKDNRLTVNALSIGMDGWLEMLAEDIKMDLKFHTNENTFSSVLSMVPGMYTESFSSLDTDGTFSLDGFARGVYNETTLPAFRVNLDVQDGYFKYPDLPAAVKEINMSLIADSPTGDLRAMSLKSPNFSINFGGNPLSGKFGLDGFAGDQMNVDAVVNGTLDLAQLNQMFPMEGTEMKGKMALNGSAKGAYNDLTGAFPVVNATFKLQDGYYKSADFPSAVSDMQIDGSMQDADGTLEHAIVNLTAFKFNIDGEPVDGRVRVENFSDPLYDLAVHGKLNLQKLGKILAYEDTEMSGTLAMDLDAQGRYSDLNAGRYAQCPASGSMSAEKLVYKSPDFPLGMRIEEARGAFTPAQLELQSMRGSVGSSQFAAFGGLKNYLGYFLLGDEVLKGNLTVNSKRFNVNEWMSDEPAAAQPAASAPVEEGSMEVVAVPAGIDFTMDCTVDEVIYDNLDLRNFRGRVIIRDQKILFENLSLNTLGGSMRMSGSYSTEDITQPAFKMNLGIDAMRIEEAYTKIKVIQTFAPAAKFMKGRFDTQLNLNGLLRGDMVPDMTTLTSKGKVKVLEGVLSGFKPLKLVSEKTKLSSFKEMKLTDTKLSFEIRDGRIYVEPFDVEQGGGNMRVQGSNGIDTSMDYDLGFDIPAGKAGQEATKHLGQLTKSQFPTGENLKINVGLGGTVDDPKITYLRSATAGAIQDLVEDKIDEVKDEIKDEIEDKVDEVRDEIEDKVDDAKEKARAEADKILKEAEAQAARIRAEGKKSADKLRAETEAKAKQVESSAKNPIEKKAKKITADKMRKEGEEAAKKIERESDQKAQKVLDDARKRADALLK